MHVQMDAQWIGGWMVDACMDKWMMDGWMGDGWMDGGCMYG